MTVKGSSKRIGVAFLAVVALVFVPVAAYWLSLTQPWYDRMLVQRMSAGPYSAPWRDDTERVAAIFPDGMASTEAVELLSRNGFSCSRQEPEDDRDAQLNCMREISEIVCRGRFTINISLSTRNTVVKRSANSYHACL
jgi:hypothetical protein